MYQVVCVDDEAFVLEDLKRSIDWMGFNMEIACATANPRDALAYLKTHPCHLLLTDISMPQMNGIELIRAAKQINPQISILVLSAYDTFDFVRSAMQQGAENYILKPLDPHELSESLSIAASHIDSRSKMTRNFGPAMLTFRSNFVETWCKGSLNEEEFLTRAGILGVNLEADNYTVIMFTAAELYSSQMPLLFDALLSLFVGNYSAHFYFETPECFVCILTKTENSFNLFRFQNEIDRLRPILPFPFCVLVGTTVDNYLDVSSSYREVKKFMYLKYTPVPFLVCRNFYFSAADMQTIEQDLSVTDPEQYLNGIFTILDQVPAPQRISFELSVTNWCVSQAVMLTDTAQLQQIIRPIVCSRNDMDEIHSYLRSLVTSVRQILDLSTNSSARQYVKKVIDMIHDFSDKEISLKTLAVRLNMNPSYLGSIFHQQTGSYFNDYLNEERLKYAANLMKNRKLSLKNIADQAGFSSQTYFNKQFKKYYGISPNQYRHETS